MNTTAALIAIAIYAAALTAWAVYLHISIARLAHLTNALAQQGLTTLEIIESLQGNIEDLAKGITEYSKQQRGE